MTENFQQSNSNVLFMRELYFNSYTLQGRKLVN